MREKAVKKSVMIKSSLAATIRCAAIEANVSLGDFHEAMFTFWVNDERGLDDASEQHLKNLKALILLASTGPHDNITDNLNDAVKLVTGKTSTSTLQDIKDYNNQRVGGKLQN